MRVITGLYKGRRLRTVKDFSVRPATDRVKQTIFNMLMNRIEFEGGTVLDLFAGSGSLGIEAISRGAASATFVEQNIEAAGLIEQNVAALGCEDRTRVLTMDAMDYVRRADGTFDLVFADPPYAYGRIGELPSAIFSRNLVHSDGYLIIEHPSTLRFESTEMYSAGPEKKFGRTLVTFFHHPDRP
jgi:16S rRNA (guanine966-N2)-methyltransferase